MISVRIGKGLCFARWRNGIGRKFVQNEARVVDDDGNGYLHLASTNENAAEGVPPTQRETFCDGMRALLRVLLWHFTGYFGMWFLLSMLCHIGWVPAFCVQPSPW